MEKLLVSVLLEQNDKVAGYGSPQGRLHYPRHAEAMFDFSQPFISLFINILHIKICVGSQKRAASTQYSTQWRGLGISGSVLWDLDGGGCPFFTLCFKSTSNFFLCSLTKIRSMSNTDLWSQLMLSKNQIKPGLPWSFCRDVHICF